MWKQSCRSIVCLKFPLIKRLQEKKCTFKNVLFQAYQSKSVLNLWKTQYVTFTLQYLLRCVWTAECSSEIVSKYMHLKPLRLLGYFNYIYFEVIISFLQQGRVHNCTLASNCGLIAAIFAGCKKGNYWWSKRYLLCCTSLSIFLSKVELMGEWVTSKCAWTPLHSERIIVQKAV